MPFCHISITYINPMLSAIIFCSTNIWKTNNLLAGIQNFVQVWFGVCMCILYIYAHSTRTCNANMKFGPCNSKKLQGSVLYGFIWFWLFPADYCGECIICILFYSTGTVIVTLTIILVINFKEPSGFTKNKYQKRPPRKVSYKALNDSFLFGFFFVERRIAKHYLWRHMRNHDLGH